jgi:hypothetical protein
VRAIVVCEESGRVRRALRGYGVDAWSNDILPASDGSRFHLQGDARQYLDMGWDLMIAHPPCTHLANSGARWMTDHWVKKKAHPEGRYWHDGSKKRAQTLEALQFVKDLWAAPIPRIAIENPVGRLPKLWRKWDQVIHPWQFGHGEQKQTCLWLKNLPKLVPTDIVEGRAQRVWKMPPGPERERLRSLTYLGIADAIAAQWGSLDIATERRMAA